MIQFFAPDISKTLTLPESDSQHCVRVLRMHEGDRVQVVDGQGSVHTCRLVTAHPKHATVEIVETVKVMPGWPMHITVGIAPTKHMDRMEWAVEKLTEIGVNRIVPLVCDRSERREIKTERLVKTAISAMKQSLKAHLPQIDDAMPLKKFLNECRAPQRFIAYCDATIPRRELAALYAPSGGDAAIIIGPEGDFSPQEITFAIESGWQPVALGPERLRTETAAIVAADTFHVIMQYVKHHQP